MCNALRCSTLLIAIDLPLENGCNSFYVGEKSWHLSTRVGEHLHSNKNSHIFKHLKSSDKCRKSCSDKCFAVLDTASTYSQFRIKEALHIL